MLEVNHIVYITHEDGTDEEILLLHKTEDGQFIFDPVWEHTDCWLTFTEEEDGIWQVVIEEAVPSGRDDDYEPDIQTEIIGRCDSIDDAVRSWYYWDFVTGG